MNPESQTLIGLWDVHSGTVTSQLLLQPDGTFSHMLWGGVQSYWGNWSVQQQQGHDVLALTLSGAQPSVTPGPYGPVPINWPPAESWAITAVTPNQVTFWGAIMLRHLLAPGAEPVGAPSSYLGSFPDPSAALQPPAFTPQFTPQFSPAQSPPYLPPTPSPFNPAAAMPAPVPAGAQPHQAVPVAATPMQIPLPPNYSMPAPQTMPPPHNAPVHLQWQGADRETQQKLQAIQNSMWEDDQKTNLDIMNMQNTAFNDRFNSIEQNNIATMKMNHDLAAKYIASIAPRGY